MSRIPQFGAMTVAAALLALPVLAQNVQTPTAAPTNTPATGMANDHALARAMPGTTVMTSPGIGGAANAGGNAGGIGNAPVGGDAGTTMGATPATVANTGANPSAPSDKNPVLSDDGQVRASKVIGASVYNDHNEKIGSVDDILMGKDNQPATAVISVGGFLGMGSKLVSVPYDKLQFGDTATNNGNRVVMPGASKDALNGMLDYHYNKNS